MAARWRRAGWSWQVINQSDVLIAGRFLTPSAVGLYSRLAPSRHAAPCARDGHREPGGVPGGGAASGRSSALARALALRPALARVRERSGHVWNRRRWHPSWSSWRSVRRGRTRRIRFGWSVCSSSLRMVSGIVPTTIIGVRAPLDLWNTAINLLVLPTLLPDPACRCGRRRTRDRVGGGPASVVLSMTIPRNCKNAGGSRSATSRARFGIRSWRAAPWYAHGHRGPDVPGERAERLRGFPCSSLIGAARSTCASRF